MKGLMMPATEYPNVNMTVVCSCSPQRQFSARGPSNSTPPCPRCKKQTSRVKDQEQPKEVNNKQDSSEFVNYYDSLDGIPSIKQRQRQTKQRRRNWIKSNKVQNN